MKWSTKSAKGTHMIAVEQDYTKFIQKGFNAPDEGKGRLPDFIGLGVRRCASTYLQNMLMQHPELAFPRISPDVPFCCDPGFFEKLKKEGPFILKESHMWTPFYLDWKQKLGYLNTYKRLFEHAQPWQKAGEVSAIYLLFLTYGNFIGDFKKILPHVKLFFTIRNPVERLISDFFHWPPNEEENPDFEACVNTIAWRVSNNQVNTVDYHNRLFLTGFYHNSIQRLYQYFPIDQVHIILFEEIKENPKVALRRLCRFLDIDEGFEFRDIEKPVKPALVEKSYKKRNTATAEQKQKLIDLYRPSILNLSKIINRDLTGWLDVESIN